MRVLGRLSVLVGLAAIVLYLTYGSVTPCGILRGVVRQHDSTAAILPDAFIDFGMSFQFGELSPAKCLSVLLQSYTEQRRCRCRESRMKLSQQVLGPGLGTSSQRLQRRRTAYSKNCRNDSGRGDARGTLEERLKSYGYFEMVEFANPAGAFRVNTWGAGPFVIKAGGKTYRFEDNDRFGPSLVKKNGDISSNPWPVEGSPFWRAHRIWVRQGRRLGKDGMTCIWQEPEPTIIKWLSKKAAIILKQGEPDGRVIEKKKGEVPKGRILMSAAALSMDT